jgi:hypothetical protein
MKSGEMKTSRMMIYLTRQGDAKAKCSTKSCHVFMHSFGCLRGRSAWGTYDNIRQEQSYLCNVIRQRVTFPIKDRVKFSGARRLDRSTLTPMGAFEP